MKHLDKLLNTQKTVFSYDDVSLLLWVHNRDTLKSFFARWKKEWVLYNISKWLYTLYHYDQLELASKLRQNSYISFETILKKEWVIFQDYAQTIFLASDNTITKNLDGISFVYLKLKHSILTNPLWIINKWSYMMASKERAICDRLYLSVGYYFDCLDWVDFKLLQSIAQIYNKRVVLSVQKMIQDAK